VDDYSYFIGEVTQKDSMNTRFRAKDFSIISIIKILEALNGKSRSFHDFYLKSGVGMKASFLSYSNMLQEFGLIEKKAVGKVYVFYSITQKGRTFLGLFRK